MPTLTIVLKGGSKPVESDFHSLAKAKARADELAKETGKTFIVIQSTEMHDTSVQKMVFDF